MNINQQKRKQNETFRTSDLIENLINSKVIVNIGKITKVYNDNFIKVKYYNIDEEVDNVRLLHVGTDKYRVIVQPAIGDNVLLLSTQMLVMKLVPEVDPEPSTTFAPPYSDSTTNAILISTEDDADVLTYITVDEKGNAALKSQGEITAMTTDENWEEKESAFIGLDSIKLNDAVNKAHVLLDESGIEVVDENHKQSVKMTESGTEVKDEANSNTVTLDKNGVSVSDANNNSVKLDKNGIAAKNSSSGIIETGNSVDTLGSLLDALANIVFTLKTYGSPAAHAVDPSSQQQITQWRQKLAQVLK